MRLLAIDPGNTESAYVVIDTVDKAPIYFGKIGNEHLLSSIIDHDGPFQSVERTAIEMVASYGMAVGSEVFETCVWVGRFYQALLTNRCHPRMVKRLPVKLHHCGQARAKDTNIRQALVDRFAPGKPNNGKGTKAKPGWFYGFHSDVWAAYALAVYAADMIKDGVSYGE